MANTAATIIDAEIADLTRQREVAARQIDELAARITTIDIKIEAISALRERLPKDDGAEVDEPSHPLTIAEHFEPIRPTRAILAFLRQFPGKSRGEIIETVASLNNLDTTSGDRKRLIDSSLRQLEGRGKVFQSENGGFEINE